MAGYKRSYTIEEDNVILEKIVSTQSFHLLKGVMFWKELQNSSFENRRSWMSLKNRFIRSILPCIHDPRYTLSASDKERIVNAYLGKSGPGQVASNEEEVIVLSD